MVEPVSLTVGALAAGLVVKLAERATDETADAAFGAMKKLVSWLRSRFGGGSDEEAAAALEKVTEVPDSPSRAAFLAGILDKRASSDAKFRAELERLLSEAEEAGASPADIVQSAVGDGNVQIADVQGGSVSVTIGGSPSAKRPAAG